MYDVAIVAIVFGSIMIIVIAKGLFKLLSSKNNHTDDQIVNELHTIITKLEQRVDVLESLLDKK